MFTTFQNYIRAALEKAQYDLDKEQKVFVASVPDLPGVVAQAKTIEQARAELAEVIEDWVIVGLQFGDEIPAIGGIRIRQINRQTKKQELAHA